MTSNNATHLIFLVLKTIPFNRNSRVLGPKHLNRFYLVIWQTMTKIFHQSSVALRQITVQQVAMTLSRLSTLLPMTNWMFLHLLMGLAFNKTYQTNCMFHLLKVGLVKITINTAMTEIAVFHGRGHQYHLISSLRITEVSINNR